MSETKYLSDRGGRRSGIERRKFSFDGYFPERRQRQRRTQLDRRSGEDRRKSRTEVAFERRAGGDRRAKKPGAAASEGHLGDAPPAPPYFSHPEN